MIRRGLLEEIENVTTTVDPERFPVKRLHLATAKTHEIFDERIAKKMGQFALGPCGQVFGSVGSEPPGPFDHFRRDHLMIALGASTAAHQVYPVSHDTQFGLERS